MSSWVLLMSLLFDLNSSQKTFEAFCFKGKNTVKGIEISIYSSDYQNVDLIVIEKYDTLNKIFSKFHDLTQKELLEAKGDTFKYIIPGRFKDLLIADQIQIKFITKDRIIKIYNDIDANGFFFTNQDKRAATFAKSAKNLSSLSQLQKQALKKELKLEEQGYELVKETNIVELVYNSDIEQYFIVKYNEFLEEENQLLNFAIEQEKISELLSSIIRNSLSDQAVLETTWEELDFKSFSHIFEKWSN